MASFSDKELFVSETASSDLLVRTLAPSVVVRNFRPVLLRNVVMDGADGVGLIDDARGILIVVDGEAFDKVIARGLAAEQKKYKRLINK